MINENEKSYLSRSVRLLKESITQLQEERDSLENSDDVIITPSNEIMPSYERRKQLFNEIFVLKQMLTHQQKLLSELE